MTKQKTRYQMLFLGILSAGVFSTPFAAVSADSLAKIVLSKAGIRAGICELPRVGDGSLAVALAKQGAVVVHGLASDAPSTLAAQQFVDQNSISSAKVIIETGIASKTPLGGWVADLLAAVDVADADLSSLSTAEIIRVLAPYRGKAVVGQPVDGKGGLTQAALTTWARQIDPSAVVTQDGLGLWAVMTMPALRGSDDWGQWFHTPDNNNVSKDTLVKWPLLTQWMGEPYHVPSPVMTLVSAGRLFQFIGRGGVSKYGAYDSLQGTLLARSAYNGSLLWKRTFKSNFGVFRSCAVATPATLYLADTAGGVLLLDPETGIQKGRINFSGVAGDVKWLALDSNRLYILAGDPDPAMIPGGIYNESNIQTGEIPWGFGKALSAYDLQTNATVWSHTETADIDSRNMGMCEGKLYFYAPGFRFGALSKATGSLVWQNNNSSVLALLGDAIDYSRLVVNINRVSSATRCHPLAVTFSVTGHLNLVTLSAATGALLWSKDASSLQQWGFVHQYFLGNDLILGHDNEVYDIATGVRKGNYSGAGTCGRTTANANGLFGQSGMAWNFKTNASTNSNGLKASCYATVLPANGLMLSTPTSCTCPVSNRGAVVYRSADTVVRNGAAGTLETGSAAVADQLAVGAADWSTARSNISRNGTSAATIPLPANPAWQYVPGVPNVPTAVSTAGNYSFFGADDGTIRCLDVLGRLVWSQHTGGAVRTAPTIAFNRVYAGSNDGYVYAFAAKTGALLWRYRLAKTQRRIMLYGKLTDGWAVTGIAVKDSVVYATAGMNKFDSAYVCALNAVSGQLAWQRSIGEVNQQSWRNGGAASTGNFTVAQGHLWVDGGFFNSPTGLKLTNGAITAADWRGDRTSQAGVLRTKYLLLSGPTMFRYEGERQSTNQTNPALFALDDTGALQVPELELADRSLFTPAWDDNDIILSCSGHQSEGMTSFDATKLTGIVDTMRKAIKPEYPWTRTGKKVFYSDSALVQAGRRWSITNKMIYSVAMTPTLVVAAYAVPANPPVTFGVCALNRSNGQSAWDNVLPSEPVIDGLSISAAGRIIVPLKNGTIVTFFGGTVSVQHPPYARPETTPVPAVAESVVEQDYAGLTAVSAQPRSKRVQKVTAANPFLDRITAEPGYDTLAAQQAYQAAQIPTAPQRPNEFNTVQKRDMSWNPDHICLTVTGVTASSSTRTGGPGNTIDRQLTSRWQPSETANQWLTYDLGSVQSVAGAGVVWYSLRALKTACQVETSLDGKEYTVADKRRLTGRGTNTLNSAFRPVMARYVRVCIENAGTAAAPSVYEVGIFGETKKSVASGQ